MKNKVLICLAMVLIVGAAAPAFAQNGPYQYHALTPCRVVDTRNADPNTPFVGNGGPALPSSTTTINVTTQTRAFTIKTHCGVPNTANAVTVNFTITAPTYQGHLRVFPGGTTPPYASTINFQTGNVIANGAIVPLSALTTGDLGVYLYEVTAGGTANVIIDVTGYFDDGVL